MSHIQSKGVISEEVKKIIEANPLALATADLSNKPNVIAVTAVKVVSKEEILITDNYMYHTKNNLQINKNVCLAVWTKDEQEGYKLSGNAEYFNSGKWLDYVKKMPENKGMPAKGAILVKVLRLTKLA